MIENIFTFTILWFISFFPIVIWAYIFSYIDNNKLNKKRFLIGILWWVISVIPVLYMENVLQLINIPYINIFYFISQIKWFLSILELWLSLWLIIIILALFSFILWWFIHKFKKIIFIYIKNIIIFLIFIIFLWFIFFILNILFSNLDINISREINFLNIVFDSLKLIIFYYLIVAFIEESSKHFNFLQSSILQITSIKQWVLYAIFVALWFSLIENILYLYNYYSINWFNSELIKIYFFRSLFSVIVHILSSAVVWYYFSKALILYRDNNLSFPYLKIFFFWLCISILLHLFFDVAITLGFSFIMFFYFIWWYLYVSSIFFKNK